MSKNIFYSAMSEWGFSNYFWSYFGRLRGHQDDRKYLLLLALHRCPHAKDSQVNRNKELHFKLGLKSLPYNHAIKHATFENRITHFRQNRFPLQRFTKVLFTASKIPNCLLRPEWTVGWASTTEPTSFYSHSQIHVRTVSFLYFPYWIAFYYFFLS